MFKHAADFWAQRIDSPVEILVRAKFEPLACSSTSAVLGSAGTTQVWSNFSGAPRADTWYPIALASKLAGEDLDPDDEEINATFNTALDDGSCAWPRKWYYGLDAQPTAGTTDFATTVIHELGHGLGFQTFVERSTGRRFPYGDPEALDDAFMVRLYDGTVSKTWDQMTDGERLASVTNTSNLLWNGPEVTAVASSVLSAGVGLGGRAQMYAPNPFESGSSVSHWDTAVSPSEIMEPFLVNGAQLLITDELMKDLGWGLASGTPTNHWILPSSARAPGQGGAFYTTALSIANRGAAEARYRMKFLGNNADGTDGPESHRVHPRPEPVGHVRGRPRLGLRPARPHYGAIRVTANVTTLSVLGQTSTPVLTSWASCVATGSFGQSVPAFAPADLVSAGSPKVIVGVREDATFRTNLILTNAGTASVDVTATLFAPSGAVLGSATWTLPPLGMTQKTQFARDLGATGDVRDANVLLSTSTSGGSFAAYAAVIDKTTNDPRTLLPR